MSDGILDYELKVVKLTLYFKAPLFSVALTEFGELKPETNQSHHSSHKFSKKCKGLVIYLTG